MTWISSLFSRYWRNLHFAVILLLVAVLIYGNNNINGYVSQAALTFYHPFSRVWCAIKELSAVNTENHRLRQSLVETSLRLTELEEMKRENKRLRSILRFEPPLGYSLLPARVIYISGDKMPISALINRGRVDSVFVNQTIINQEGLVGRITKVTPYDANVQLLTDLGNRVAARVAGNREIGIVKYNITDGMILDNFPIQGNIGEGNLVVSSGLGRVYPPGLVIGTVVFVGRPEEEPFCRIQLAPAVNFGSLEEVFILRPDSQ